MQAVHRRQAFSHARALCGAEKFCSAGQLRISSTPPLLLFVALARRDRRSLGTVRLSRSPSFIPYRERKHPQTASDPRYIVDKALSETRAGRSQSERRMGVDVVPSRRAITAQMRCTAHLFGNLQQPKLAIAAIGMPDRRNQAAVSHWQCRRNYCGNHSAAKAASFIVLQAVTDSWLHADRDASQPGCSYRFARANKARDTLHRLRLCTRPGFRPLPGRPGAHSRRGDDVHCRGGLHYGTSIDFETWDGVRPTSLLVLACGRRSLVVIAADSDRPA